VTREDLWNVTNWDRAKESGSRGANPRAVPQSGHDQEPVSQVAIKQMSYAHFATAPNARPDASASANSAMFLVIKSPTRIA
jgi:hypothetical protein